MTRTIWILALIAYINATAVLPETDDLICRGAHCYPRVFQPSHEFQPILEGQEIPKGLHVRLDMTTGKKEAKWMDEADDTQRHALTVQSDVKETIEKKPMTNRQSFTHNIGILMGALNSGVTEAASPVVIQALTELEELVHDMDFGEELVKHALYNKMLRVLEHDKNMDDTAVYKMATILGSSVQNNPAAQHEALKLDIVARLLGILQYRTQEIKSTKPITRIVYALASIVRNNVLGYKAFIAAHGPSELAHVFTIPFVQVSTAADRHTGGIQQKLITFMTDLADPDMYEHHDEAFPSIDDKDVLVWCDLMLNTAMDIHLVEDVRTDAIRGLVVFRHAYASACGHETKMREWTNQARQGASEVLLDELNELRNTFSHA